MFHGHLDYFKKPPLGGRPNTKPGDHIWHSERSQRLVYFILSCVRTCMNRNSLRYHLVESPNTYDFTLHLRVRDHVTWFWRCLGTAFEHFLLGSHNFMVMALGLCVKWPLCQVYKQLSSIDVMFFKWTPSLLLMDHDRMSPSYGCYSTNLMKVVMWWFCGFFLSGYFPTHVGFF